MSSQQIRDLEEQERQAVESLQLLRVDLALLRAKRDAARRLRAAKEREAAERKARRSPNTKHEPWCNGMRGHAGECQARST